MDGASIPAVPTDAIAQVRAVADTLTSSAAPLSVDDITARFKARAVEETRTRVVGHAGRAGRAHENDGRYRAIP
jgi:hypothetical protein